ncbi:MAG: sensor domain-containing phosphodiesterase [Pseudomonadota bacterium]|nr:sensor domain-containing phosphodiesterase [Pseudomonadota bacterium]
MTYDSLTAIDESARLQALDSYAILDTPPEVIFDELARMAAMICETPIALVSLVDGQRQWFKAHIGLDATETPRDISFCVHAIQGIEVFVVPDAQKDLRFSQNPLVTGPPSIGFYAGAPLITSEGAALGTLCVIDRRPRELSSDQIEALRLLSRHVVAQLELRRRIRDLSSESVRRSREMGALISSQRQHIDRLAHYNPQTGLANRALFVKWLAKELAPTPLLARASSAVFVVELQRFDLLTEAFGPDGMDALLTEIAPRISSCASDAHHVAHVRDERFALFRPAVSGGTQAALFAESELLAKLNETYLINGTEVRPTFKIGIALSPTDGTDPDTLLAAATTALVTAKASHAPLAFCSPEIATRVAGALTLEAKLRRALEREEFVVHYQPKVSLRDGQITGVEALLRWADPQGQSRADDGGPALVPPARFMPLLEDSGLIVPVGLWVMQRAAKDWADWTARGISIPRVAVNVSGLQLRENRFVRDVCDILATYDSPALDIEITEGIFLDESSPSVQRLRDLQALSMRIAIDDFGTGYSSMRYLSTLPVDVLKIDQIFVNAMTRRPEDMGIVSSIISLAHSLRFSTIAEGVETEEQRNLLRLLRCDEIQGYLYSRPLSATDLEAMVARPCHSIDRKSRLCAAEHGQASRLKGELSLPTAPHVDM